MDNRFGTTSGMVIQTVMENGQEFCLAIDERGLYLTSANYLDKNLADPTAIPAAGPPPKPACWPSIWTRSPGRGQCPPHPGLHRRSQEEDQPHQGFQAWSERLIDDRTVCDAPDREKSSRALTSALR